ncbi:MAG: hypothetical protein WAR79_16175 [Melioribacteraceae bacterium]
MINKKIIPIFIIALTLGLGWAIRGSFGHEWGASWAGAMGAFAIVVVSGNKNWLKNAPVLASLGAIGWAVGGMSSYGIVIGYCRTNDFLNVLYGFSMLFIIGGIYGFIGGGFLGLGLESEKENKPNWANLISQMVAGAMLTWGFLIYQLEWFMTPPRSELWAAALGASATLSWFLWRENFKKSFRIAIYTAIGAGIGFSFGNFIQVIGAASGIAYNWWNVMEFILGFSGGLAMAYAILTTTWKGEIEFSKSSNLLAIIFLFIVIPYVNFNQSFEREYLTKLSEFQSSLSSFDFASLQIYFTFLTMIVFFVISIFVWKKYSKNDEYKNENLVTFLFFINSLYYTVFLILRNGLFYSGFGLENSNTLYIPILLLIFILVYFQKNNEIKFGESISVKYYVGNWKLLTSLILVILILISFVSININSDLPGAHFRFE